MGAGEMRASPKVAQALGTQCRRQRADARLFGVERIVGGRQSKRPAFAQEVEMDVLQTPHPQAQTVVRRALDDVHAPCVNAIGNPGGKGWVSFQKETEGAGCAPTGAIAR
jgi:hypothetical protein